MVTITGEKYSDLHLGVTKLSCSKRNSHRISPNLTRLRYEKSSTIRKVAHRSALMRNAPKLDLQVSPQCLG